MNLKTVTISSSSSLHQEVQRNFLKEQQDNFNLLLYETLLNRIFFQVVEKLLWCREAASHTAKIPPCSQLVLQISQQTNLFVEKPGQFYSQLKIRRGRLKTANGSRAVNCQLQHQEIAVTKALQRRKKQQCVQGANIACERLNERADRKYKWMRTNLFEKAFFQ